ncbi:MAG: aldehyde dehydrogenase family protein, partial [Synergistaceae bacterium]|nr:aldehyde dehydrogenase family protein [Synergistaceae bacterium]MDR3281219.1 aldehyde dehydrogenase family protein [Synergistaceae bacterium]
MERPKLLEKYQLFINGKWKDASDGGTFKTTCPANGELLATCSEATKEDVDAAVDAAWNAFKTWKNVEPIERASLLNKIADAIDAHAEHLALVESCDNGKPIRETLTIDVPFASDH